MAVLARRGHWLTCGLPPSGWHEAPEEPPSRLHSCPHASPAFAPATRPHLTADTCHKKGQAGAVCVDLAPWKSGLTAWAVTGTHLRSPLVAAYICLALAAASSADNRWLNCMSRRSAKGWPAP